MNKLGIVLLVLTIGYASSLEIMSVDCEGGVRFLPSYESPIQFDFSALLGVAETFVSVYKDRLKCLCTDLTDDEFSRLFHPFFGMDMLFNIIQGPDADLHLSRCNWSAFEHVNFRANLMNKYKLDLTDTCTNETWSRDGKCMFQSQTFSDWDVALKVALFRCPKAPWRPSISIICEGQGCEQSFFPCINDNDCAGDMTCQKFYLDGVAIPSNDDLVSAFRTILQAKNIPATCVNSGDIVSNTIDWLRKMWRKGSSDYTLPYLQFCSPIKLNFTSWRQNNTQAFDWENLLHYTNSSLDITNNSIAIPGYLQPWHGELINGGKIIRPQNVVSMIPTNTTITSNATLLFKKTCDGVMTVLPTTSVRVQLNLLWQKDLLDRWVSTMLSILKCWFNYLGVSISEQELINRWGLGLDSLFFNLDAETRDDPITRPDIPDYRLKFDTRIDFPSSCNYDSWVNSGSCYTTYTGLNNLLGTDITINLEILKCPGSQDMSVTAECVGEACSLLSGMSTTCNSDADCPSSLSCKDLNAKFDFDWIGVYVGRGMWNETNQCSNNSTQSHIDIRKLIFSYWNLPYDGSSDNKYCMIDFDHMMSQVSTWLNGEVETTSPGVIKLKNLKSWNDEGKSWAASFTSDFSISLLVGGIILNWLL